MNSGIKKLVLSLAIIAGVAVIFSFRPEKSHNFEVAKNMEIFNSIVKELDMFYVDSIDPNVTIKHAINAMLYSLDPYTNYYPEDDQDEIEQMIKGSYGGIGSIISYNLKKKHSVIAEPYKGMPAAEVGLKAGDILLQIDDESLQDKDNSQVSEMLRGEIGTTFQLKVQRPGVEKPMIFNITRKAIQLPTIPYYGKVANDVGYIEFINFTEGSSNDFKKAFVDLKRQGITSLIVDLRNNGGGLLSEAVDIVNFFVPKGQSIVSTKGKISSTNRDYKTDKQPLDLETPIAFIVGSQTASAAEILAGSLQDLDRGIIVGNKTFGKGLVQTPRSLPYGALMKMTTAKYYIPSGRCVQAIDYSHRGIDGRSERIPDSLLTVFHTSIGREVKDGAGIMPDVEVTQDKLPNILFYMITENIIFDYATEFCMKHPTIADPHQFKLTDADYNAFKEYVKKQDFKYDQQSEKVLNSLKDIAEFEGYLEDSKSEFEALEKKLSHNLDKDLDYFRSNIQHILSIEIVKRYHFQEGSSIEQLKKDKELNETLTILAKDGVYKHILDPAFKPIVSDSLSILN